MKIASYTQGKGMVITKFYLEFPKAGIDIAIKRNKKDTNYIAGILKNWLEEGYPKTYEEMEFGIQKEKPMLRFNNFESRKYDKDVL